MFKSGNKRLPAALSDCIMNGIPCLARASLITVSWMCILLYLIKDENIQTMAWSVLVPQLVASLDFNKDVEERVLASCSLLNLTKSSGISYRLKLISQVSLHKFFIFGTKVDQITRPQN